MCKFENKIEINTKDRRDKFDTSHIHEIILKIKKLSHQNAKETNNKLQRMVFDIKLNAFNGYSLLLQIPFITYFNTVTH